MKVAYYKFCYWLGCKFGITNLEAWAYLHWFAIAGAGDIIGFFVFSEDYFNFCEKWGIKSNVGKTKKQKRFKTTLVKGGGDSFCGALRNNGNDIDVGIDEVLFTVDKDGIHENEEREVKDGLAQD